MSITIYSLCADIYYYAGREWPYKNVPHKIIAEQYMVDESGTADLVDYKFMCFNGKVKCIFTCTNRRSEDGLNVTFFDNNWRRLPFKRHYPADKNNISKPNCFDEMKQLSEKIAIDMGISFVRIDFYEVNHELKFGEITLFPGAGFEEFAPVEWDYILGKWISLHSFAMIN